MDIMRGIKINVVLYFQINAPEYQKGEEKTFPQDPSQALHLMRSEMNSDGLVKAQMPLRQIKSILFFSGHLLNQSKGDRLCEININFKEPYYILCQNTGTPIQIYKLFKHPMKAIPLGFNISRFSLAMKNLQYILHN